MNLTRNLKQTIVWWRKTGKDGYGKPVLADPIEIAGRWEDKQRKIVSQGEEIISQAMIFVDRDIAIGDWLFLGRLSDLSSSEEASPFVLAKEVKSFDKTPNIKGTAFERKAWV